MTVAMKGGVAPSEVRKRFPRRAEIPFDAGAKLMATEHQTAEGPRIVIGDDNFTTIDALHALGSTVLWDERRP